MARGLVGKSAERFFNNTSEALGRAAEAHSRDPFEGMRGSYANAGYVGQSSASVVSVNSSLANTVAVRAISVNDSLANVRNVRDVSINKSFINSGYVNVAPANETSISLPRLPSVVNLPAPFKAEDAWSEVSQARNRGDSSNIVVDSHVYHSAMRRMDMIDNQAGADIHRCCNAIEEMCASMYIVPETVPRVMEIVSRVKGSLGQFRSLTAEIDMSANRFINAAAEIDHGNMSNIVVSRAPADQAIHRVADTMSRQADNMERTERGYRDQAVTLAEQARSRRNRAHEARQQRLSLRSNADNLNVW